jgi:hypothetical protein
VGQKSGKYPSESYFKLNYSLKFNKLRDRNFMVMNMIKCIFFIITSLLLLDSCQKEKVNGITISAGLSVVTIENKLISVKYDLKSGTYSAFDKVRKIEAVYNATCQINNFNSGEKGVTAFYTSESIDEKSGKGAAILITSKKENYPDQLFKIKLYDNQGFLTLQSGIRNTLKTPYIIKSFAPVKNASLFNGSDLKENFRVMDGEGGGIETYIRKEPTIVSQNNIVLSFGNGKERYSMVAGGVTYREFEKFVTLTEDHKREPDISKLAPDLNLLEYIDLGDISKKDIPKYADIDKFQNKTRFKFAGSFTEAKSIIYNAEDIKIQPQNIDTTKIYTLAVIWGSNYSTQRQSVILFKNGKEEKLISSALLPDLSQGKDPDLYFIPVTPAMMHGGMPTIVIRKNGGSSTVLNEAALFEGAVPGDKQLVPIKAGRSPSLFNKVKFTLYAEDPVGKKVDAGQTYLPGKDAFYLDFSTVNPIESAEKYAQTIKAEQEVNLNYYYFPTICLWYAMQPLYGGAGSKRAINDSPGAVEEMARVKDSGWLKYTTMAIRLVPDCYSENNENGWWDDLHWQKYGSGSEEKQGTKRMNLKIGHYRAPYETSKKWAQAVINMGGLPFTYFQTGVRSNDYCEQFPTQMLHNQSYYKVENQSFGLNKNFGTYDFTDSSFVAHMHEVYNNLNDAGIAGMMFDYPNTAWAPYGGMDDKYCTTGGMYRKVFDLAYNGLGEKSYIHERNISRGSDITAGVVASQRIWGDNDVLTAEMVMRGGLRWYKNRVLFNYDMDAKSLTKAQPADSDDGINKLLTMSYLAASRLLLSQSFAIMTPKLVYKLSRIFPYPQSAQSARPIDAFSGDYPRVYDFRVTGKWHQLTFFNEDDTKPKTVSVELSGTPGFGGMGLEKNNSYYIYDFWNNCFVGEFNGDAVLTQNLRKGEARMMSVHQKEDHPQVLSTDRHIMQGYNELSEIRWSDNKLSGKAEMIENEPMKIIIAHNGSQPQKAEAAGCSASFVILSDKLIELTIISHQKRKAEWTVEFKKF